MAFRLWFIPKLSLKDNSSRAACGPRSLLLALPFCCASARRRRSRAMNAAHNKLIADALSAPPPPPAECALRTLELSKPLKLRVPAENTITSNHIRAAHAVAIASSAEVNSSAYHSALQAEYSRLQDAQPWYWDQLWPGGIALARRLLAEPELVRGRTVLEFGSGIGLTACAAALAGASCILATDNEPSALAFTAQSASDNGLADGVLATCAWDWEQAPPAEVAARAPFDVVMLPDVMYDEAAVERLGALAPTLVAPGGLLLWADGTDRPYGESHSVRLRQLVLGSDGARAWTAGSSESGVFRVRSSEELHAGASKEDGGAAPDRPVLLVIVEREGAEPPDVSDASGQRSSSTDPAKVAAGLLIGSKLAAGDRERLRAHGITHVLNAAREIPNFHEADGTLTYLQLALNDDEDDDIQAEFARCSAWISKAQAAGGIVFVHCQAGISRSAALVIAHLMTAEKATLREAFLRVKERRPNIGPNMHFMKALGEYEDALRPPERRGEPPSFDMETYYAEALVDMGFDRAAALTAVKRAEGRWELAVQFCLSGV